MSGYRMIRFPFFILLGMVAGSFAGNTLLPVPEKEPEFYSNKWLVITATETEKEMCTCEHGVVLNTDNYGNLRDGLFVCVNAVCQHKNEAVNVSTGLKSGGVDCYIKNSGAFKSVSPAGISEQKIAAGKDSVLMPFFIRTLNFKNTSSGKVSPKKEYGINRDISIVLEESHGSGVENGITGVDVEFINKMSGKMSSVKIEIESDDPLFNMPKVNVYSLQKESYLISFEYADYYVPYLNIVVINGDAQIEYTGKYEGYRLVGIELKDLLPVVKLTRNLDTIDVVWKNKKLNRN